MRRALIIGSEGQDGQILWDQLVAQGFSLIGISRERFNNHAAQWNKKIDVRDGSAVKDLVSTFRPSQIYYLAAHHQSSEEHADNERVWRTSWDVNVEGFVNFLRAAAIQTEKPRVFYASSSRIFGNVSDVLVDESTTMRPACVYGASKASAMLIANYFREAMGVPVSCGILFNHESPLRQSRFVSRRVADGLVAMKFGGADILRVGLLDAQVDWGYAPDYTRAMQLLLEAEQLGNFIIATGETRTVRDMIYAGAAILNLNIEGRVLETQELLARAPQGLCGNASRLRDLTGWAPQLNFQEMMEILVSVAVERYKKSGALRDQ